MAGERFTIEDIHRIRYDNYEKTKHMSPKELIDYTKKQAEEGKRLLKELRQKSPKTSGN